MKRICGILILGLLGHSLSAQTIREKIDKAHKDPSNTEKTAKADARLIDKKIIADTSSTKKKPARMTSDGPRKRSRALLFRKKEN